ncbi:MAG: tetratricopeptide repeat protein [Prevotella sp.]|nr:tetratricopeptide repeat protein [Prevotella sp.]MBP5506354.1 tetratricopeptide repeat protein [Prevotella sp.]
MRSYLLIIALVFATGAEAQSYADLRDSLEVAVSQLRRFPNNINLRLNKASWNMLLEQWDYAKEEYDWILERDPKNVAALYYRAYIYEKQHKYKFARKDYETMLSIVPDHFNGQLGFALLCQKDMRYSEAMDRINILIEQYPDSAVAYAARAGLEAERGLNEVAEYDFSEAMRLDPSCSDYILNRADIRLKMGRKKEAREDLDRAVLAGVPRPALSEMYARCKE